MSEQPRKERDADFSKLDEMESQGNAQSIEEGVAIEEGVEGDRDSSIDQDLPAVDDAPSEDRNNSPEQEEIAALRAEINEFKDKYLRALAEIENVKKRGMKERADLLKYQGERILVDVLEVADNLERAMAEKEASADKMRDGVALILKLLIDTLSRWEVKGESAIGKDFDPKIQRAIGQAPVQGAKVGSVIAEMKKAYFYKDKLLRVGEVVVAAEPPAAADSGNKGEA